MKCDYVLLYFACLFETETSPPKSQNTWIDCQRIVKRVLKSPGLNQIFNNIVSQVTYTNHQCK
jgi:hypothetical protein